jgi:peroxiredoxin
MRLERNRQLALPSLPFGPGRAPLTPRARRALALSLGGLVLVTIALGGVLVARSPTPPPRVVTIPAADRDASPALLRAAEAVGFEPVLESGAGRIEDEPLVIAPPPTAQGLLDVGARAPAFVLRTPTGARVSLRAYRGKAVLLEFFATWCPHCNAEASHLVRLAHTLPPSRYAFLAVDADGETAPSVLAFHIYYGFEFPALLDPSSRPGTFHAAGAPGPVSRAYHVSVFPTFYVLDAQGRVRWAGAGEQPDALVREQLLRAARAGSPAGG